MKIIRKNVLETSNNLLIIKNIKQLRFILYIGIIFLYNIKLIKIQ